MHIVHREAEPLRRGVARVGQQKGAMVKVEMHLQRCGRHAREPHQESGLVPFELRERYGKGMGKVWERYGKGMIMMGYSFFLEDLEGLQNHDCFIWELQLSSLASVSAWIVYP